MFPDRRHALDAGLRPASGSLAAGLSAFVFLRVLCVLRVCRRHRADGHAKLVAMQRDPIFGSSILGFFVLAVGTVQMYTQASQRHSVNLRFFDSSVLRVCRRPVERDTENRRRVVTRKER